MPVEDCIRQIRADSAARARRASKRLAANPDWAYRPIPWLAKRLGVKPGTLRDRKRNFWKPVCDVWEQITGCKFPDKGELRWPTLAALADRALKLLTSPTWLRSVKASALPRKFRVSPNVLRSDAAFQRVRDRLAEIDERFKPPAADPLIEVLARLRGNAELRSQSAKKLTRGPVATNLIGVSCETFKRLKKQSKELQELHKPDDRETAMRKTLEARGAKDLDELNAHREWAELEDAEVAEKLGITVHTLRTGRFHAGVRERLAALRGKPRPVGRWPDADEKVQKAIQDLNDAESRDLDAAAQLGARSYEKLAVAYGVDARTVRGERWQAYWQEVKRIAQKQAAAAAAKSADERVELTFQQVHKELGCSKKHIYECIRNGRLKPEDRLLANGRPKLEKFFRRAEVLALKTPPPPARELERRKHKVVLFDDATAESYGVSKNVLLLWIEQTCVWLGRKVRVWHEPDPTVGAGKRRYVFDDDVEDALAIRAYCLEHGWSPPRGAEGWNPSDPPRQLIAEARAERDRERRARGGVKPKPKIGRPKGAVDPKVQKRNERWLASLEGDPPEYGSIVELAIAIHRPPTTVYSGVAEAKSRRELRKN